MKYLIGLCLLITIGCTDSDEQTNPHLNMVYLGSGVYKFTDGNITCYKYYNNGVACVVNK